MATSDEIKRKALELSEKTDSNSITPKEVGGIMHDLASLGENAIRNGGTLGIRKVYESVAAMEADSISPVDLWGNPIKKGNLVVIYDGTSSGVDNNKIYAFLKPGWQIATHLDAGYATKASLDAAIENILLQFRDSENALNESIGNLKETVTGNKQEVDAKLSELGSYIENPEYVRAYIDNKGRFLWGIKTDGSIEWSKGIPTPVRDFVESIDLKNDEEVNRINHLVVGLLGDVENITDTHHYISNPEWMQITTNSEGQILEGMSNDGKKFFPKQEMLEKYDDTEGRSEMTLDKDGRILSFRDSAGVKHECRQHTKEASFGRMNLTKENGNEIAKILENVGFKTKSPVDFSNDEWIELPTPRVAAVVRLYVGKMPTSKTDNIEGQLEYIDKDGNYFKKAIVLNSQGSSSMGYIKPDGSQGNLSVDFVDCKVKFGKWVSQDSFHIKKYYIDAFRGQCVVGYHLIEQVYQTRALGHKKPFEYLNENDSIYEGIGQFEKDYNTGALCHPDGFPVIIYVNTNGEDKLYGVYAWCLKKHRDNYYSDKSKATNIILDGVLTDANIWNGQVNWSQFEIRNPKNLKDIDGNEYDGDNPRELSDYDSLSKETKGYIERLSGAKSELILNNKKEVFENYFLVDYFIDYYLTSQVLYNVDGFGKNWIWCTWDGRLWTPTIYDVDSIFGAHPSGTFVEIDSINTILSNSVTDILNGLYANEISERYKELRASKVFDVDNITKLLSDWIDRIGFQNLKNDLELFKETPSYRNSFINKEWTVLQYHWGGIADSFDMGKTYQEGEMCYYKNYSFKALKQTTGVPPLSQLYSSAPKAMGFFNSLSRVKNWLVKRLEYLDGLYQYNY